MNKEYWIVENLDSKGFYLEYEHVNDPVSFGRDVEHCSHYSSEGLAQSVIERIQMQGFTMKLVPRKLKISYEIC
jgi:hypothetical protein